MTPELVIGRGRGFDFHLRFAATSWQNLSNELDTAIKILQGYRETAIKMKLHLKQEPTLMDTIDGGL